MQRYDEGFHAPLSQYLGQYKTIDARIEERNLRLVDMDRYKFEVARTVLLASLYLTPLNHRSRA